MRKFLLSAVALGGFLATGAVGVQAAPAVTALHVEQQHASVTQVDYYWNHRHWHHRRWYHGHWHYY